MLVVLTEVKFSKCLKTPCEVINRRESLFFYIIWILAAVHIKDPA